MVTFAVVVSFMFGLALGAALGWQIALDAVKEQVAHVRRQVGEFDRYVAAALSATLHPIPDDDDDTRAA